MSSAIVIISALKVGGVLAIMCVFSLVNMITNAKFSNCSNVFKIGVVQQ